LPAEDFFTPAQAILGRAAELSSLADQKDTFASGRMDFDDRDLRAAGMNQPLLHWTKLLSVPDVEGFAALFSGVAGNSLLVVGGANFPSLRPERATRPPYL
jgi:hypothetical protein